MVAFFNLVAVFGLCLSSISASSVSANTADVQVRSVKPARMEDDFVARSAASRVEERGFLQTQVKVCVNLAQDVNFGASYFLGPQQTLGTTSGGVITSLKAGLCICVYASVDPFGLTSNVRIYLSDPNINLTDAAKAKLAAAVLNTQCGVLSFACVSGTGGIGLGAAVAGNTCISAAVNTGILGTIGFSTTAGGEFSLAQPDFAFASLSSVTDFKERCCRQTCQSGYIACQGKCYSASDYSCPSGTLSNTPSTGGSTSSSSGSGGLLGGILLPGLLKRDASRCAGGKTACPVPGTRHWDCVDTEKDVETCGGCVNPLKPNALGAGVDCTSIAGANEVGCVRGKCEIRSCARGFALSASGSSCEAMATPYGLKKNKDVLKRARRSA